MTLIPNQFLPLVISTAAASFMVNLDTYIINVSIPAIATDLSVNKADISWVVMSYNLMVVSLLLVCGKLADRVGLKKLFVSGFIIFTLSSLCCGMSQNLAQLIISRIFQGLGASILYAMPQAMIAKFMPKEERGKGFALSASAAALGIMLGSPISGLLTGTLSWHWIFFINIPVGIAVIALILMNKSLVEIKTDKKEESFDVLGSAISFLAVLGITYWLNRLNDTGFMNPAMMLLLAVSVVLTIFFVYHCKKSSNPLVDLGLLGDRKFSSANSAMFLISGFLAGNNFIIPFYLTEMKHLNEFQIGLMFIVYSLSYMMFSLASGKLSKRVSPARTAFSAAFLSVLAIIFFVLNLEKAGIAYTVVFFVMLGMAFSFFITSNNNYVMLQAKKNNEGAIAGLHRMTGRFGMLFGVVVFEFVYTYSNTVGINGYIVTYVTGAMICLLAAMLSLDCIISAEEKGN